MDKVFVKQAFAKTINNFKQILPIIIGVLLLVSLSLVLIPKSFYTKIFAGNQVIDPLIGAIFGSVAAGNPLTSYIIGGEFLDQGVSLIAVTAFIVAWVSVGLIQLPAESLMLGKRFALARNIVSFITAIIVAVLTVLTLSIL
jgi:uncharacterized membrane protein YraQ (UPF0718 family)